MTAYQQRVADKIRLRERGWEWDERNRRWVLEKYGVRITVRDMDAALSMKIEPLDGEGVVAFI